MVAREPHYIRNSKFTRGRPDAVAREVEKTVIFTENVTATAKLTRLNLPAAIEEYSSLVERLVFCPFVDWGTEHYLFDSDPCSILQSLSLLRELAPDSEMLASVCLNRDYSRFKNGRQPTAAEVEWQVLAALAAGYDGIAWRGSFKSTIDRQVSALEHHLKPWLKDLAAAEIVSGIAQSNVNVFTLVNDERIYCIVLNPWLWNLDPHGMVILPEKKECIPFEVSLELPQGYEQATVIPVYGGQVDSFQQVPLKVNGAFYGGGILFRIEKNMNSEGRESAALNDFEEVFARIERRVETDFLTNSLHLPSNVAPFYCLSAYNCYFLLRDLHAQAVMDDSLALWENGKNALQKKLLRTLTAVQDDEEESWREILEFYAVFDFAEIKDSDWVQGNSEQLIKRVNAVFESEENSGIRRIFEDLSIMLSRSSTAYSFHRFTTSPDEPRLLDYYFQKACSLAEQSQFQEALLCLTAAQEATVNAEDKIAAVEKIAAILGIMGHAGKAASELEELLSQFPESTRRGKWEATRLHCLYEAELYEQLTEEIDHKLNLPEYALIRSHLLWLGWNACRKIDKHQQAQVLAELFLNEFPHDKRAALIAKLLPETSDTQYRIKMICSE